MSETIKLMQTEWTQKPPFRVCFEYDETSTKWEVMVDGAINELEARQGFNAVLITMRDATPKLECNKAERQPDGRYKIIVGV